MEKSYTSTLYIIMYSYEFIFYSYSYIEFYRKLWENRLCIFDWIITDRFDAL